MLVPNLGVLDRFARVILGFTLAGYGYLTTSWIGLLGIVPIMTAALAWSPFYNFLGLNSKFSKK